MQEEQQFVSATTNKQEEIKTIVENDFNNSILPGLEDFIRIPNLSPQFDVEWKTNGLLQKAANHIIDWVKKQEVKGCKVELIQDGPDRPPLIYIEIDGSENLNDTTILFYGHFDKQPHFTGWHEGLGPCLPVIKDGFLYGRGGSDDGYSTFASIQSIKTCQKLGLPHPRCVMTIEGEEESGSMSYMHYLNLLKDKIGQPNLIICLDSGCLDYETLWFTSSLRGYIDGTIKVQVTSEGVHSGGGSGFIPSSFRIIRQILDRFEDSKTGIVHENFHVNIPPHRYEEAYNVAQQIGKNLYSHFPYYNSTQPVSDNALEGYLNNTWRPTISYIGVDGMPASATAGNVLRPQTVLAVSMRTPPTLPSKEKADQFKQLIESNPPYNSTVTFDLVDAGNGWDAPKHIPFLADSLASASLTYFKKPVRSLGMGGSIPLMNELQDTYPKAQFIVTGILGPNSNAHGPNECLNIEFLKKVICCMTQVVADSGKFSSQFPK